METYVIKAPEGFEAVTKIVNGVTIISFIPKVIEKKLPINLNQSISYLPEICYYMDDKGSIMDFEMENVASATLADPNILTSKEYAEAFLALMQLIRFRDIWNEGWIADWEESSSKKYIMYFEGNKIKCQYCYSASYVLAFKTSELRDEFLETFRDLIETAKPLL